MLNEKDEELSRVVAEQSNQLAELQRKLKSAKQRVNSSPAEAIGVTSGASTPTPSFTQKQLETKVSKLRRSIRSQVVNQMVYKRSNSGGSRLAPIEINDVLECTIASLVGQSLYSEASSGPKQLKLVLSNEDVESIFEGTFSKSLRYGATLELTKGLSFVYTKEDSTLKITGAYKMFK